MDGSNSFKNNTKDMLEIPILCEKSISQRNHNSRLYFLRGMPYTRLVSDLYQHEIPQILQDEKFKQLLSNGDGLNNRSLPVIVKASSVKAQNGHHKDEERCELNEHSSCVYQICMSQDDRNGYAPNSRCPSQELCSIHPTAIEKVVKRDCNKKLS